VPSIRHDSVNGLIKARPALAVRLFSQFSGRQLPFTELLKVESGELPDRVSKIRYADTVICAGPPQDRWYTLVSEIETTLTDKKLKQTLCYATTLWLQTNKDAYVVIITPDKKADRFLRPVVVNAGSLTVKLVPCIVGPGQIPVITDPDQVAADPALATLSVMAHGETPEVVAGFIAGLDKVGPDDDPTEYYEHAVNMGTPKIKQALEKQMTTKWPVYSKLAREHFGKGEAKGEAKAILRFLKSRGLEVSEQQRALIEGTDDLATLDTWLDRVGVVTSTDELFDKRV
jgi:hypothetical protein